MAVISLLACTGLRLVHVPSLENGRMHASFGPRGLQTIASLTGPVFSVTNDSFTFIVTEAASNQTRTISSDSLAAPQRALNDTHATYSFTMPPPGGAVDVVYTLGSAWM